VSVYLVLEWNGNKQGRVGSGERNQQTEDAERKVVKKETKKARKKEDRNE
jgi:hypothetical protein